MNRRQARDHLMKTLRLVVAGLEDLDILPLKGRDKREPGAKEKERMEDLLRSILVRHFGRQRRLVRAKLEAYAPDRKAAMPFDVEDIYQDDDLVAELMALLQKAVRGGVALFGQTTGVQIDWTLTNTRAAEWAREYTFELVKGIDEVTKAALQAAVSQFVETPGMSIGDVMNLLPFDEERALRVSVTEITRAYATANQMAGEDLKEEFPGVRVMKQWFTNNDDRVCELCGPLDGTEVGIDENFYEPESDYEDGNPPRHVNCRCWSGTYTALEGD